MMRADYRPDQGTLDSATRPRICDPNLELMMAVQGDGLWRGPSESRRRFPDREIVCEGRNWNWIDGQNPELNLSVTCNCQLRELLP